MTDKEKQLFRRSKPWSNFRQRMRLRFDKKDYITGEDLLRDWNLHHLDMNGPLRLGQKHEGQEGKGKD